MIAPETIRKIAETCMLKGRFKLRSGLVSDTYFDKYLFESQPELLRAIADAMAELLPEGIQKIAGLELGGVPLATALSLKTGLPLLLVRKKAKEYGTQKQIEGVMDKGDRIAVIEDVITTGGQVVESCKNIGAAGGRVAAVICVVDREQGGAEKLAKAGLALRPLIRWSDVKKLTGK
jgi:orotate phosphoribosyltransferase